MPLPNETIDIIEAENTSNLSEVVNESKKKLFEAEQIKPKRKYNKSGKYSKGTPQSNTSSNTDTETPMSNNMMMQSNPEVQKVLAEAVEIPFAIAAKRTGCNELKLEKEISISLGIQLETIIRQYMPSISEKHAVLTTFIFTASMVCGIKYKIYQEWKEKNNGNETSQS